MSASWSSPPSSQVDLHVITVPLDEREDWERAEALLLEAARIESGPFVEEARSQLRRVESRLGVEAPSVEPRVTLHLPEPGRVTLLLRVATQARRKGRIEQAILRRYLRSRGPVPERVMRGHESR
jgi:hypothetical protein